LIILLQCIDKTKSTGVHNLLSPHVVIRFLFGCNSVVIRSWEANNNRNKSVQKTLLMGRR